MKDGGVFRSDDRGETWHWVNATNNRPFYYSQVRIDPSNENHLFVMGSTDAESEDGGRTFRNQTWNIHVDHHAMWIDPHNPKHILDGNDGGIDVTWDGGRSWEFLNELALSQMYSVDVDMRTAVFHLWRRAGLLLVGRSERDAQGGRHPGVRLVQGADGRRFSGSRRSRPTTRSSTPNRRTAASSATI